MLEQKQNDGFTPIAGSVNNLTFGTGAGTTSSFVFGMELQIL